MIGFHDGFVFLASFGIYCLLATRLHGKETSPSLHLVLHRTYQLIRCTIHIGWSTVSHSLLRFAPAFLVVGSCHNCLYSSIPISLVVSRSGLDICILFGDFPLPSAYSSLAALPPPGAFNTIRWILSARLDQLQVIPLINSTGSSVLVMFLRYICPDTLLSSQFLTPLSTVDSKCFNVVVIPTLNALHIL